MKAPEPRTEHRWLRRLVGEWSAAMIGEEHPPWTESVRPLGEVWIVAETLGQMPDGGQSRTLMSLGYDPAQDRFVGVWIGSMMTHMWVYSGRLEGAVLTLDCEGPDFADTGRMARYQDIIELKGDDLRTLTARTQQADGSWKEFMVTEYRRKS